MAGLETQQTTANEVSHAEWSAQDRLRQELRELEEQHRAEQAEQGVAETTKSKVAQAVEERIRRASTTQTELTRETGIRNRKRRKGGLLQQIPYSFDVLCLCAVTIGAAFVMGPLTHPTPNGHWIPPRPTASGSIDLLNLGGRVATLPVFTDVANNNWGGSRIEITSETPGPDGKPHLLAHLTFLKNGVEYGFEDCEGEIDPATRQAKLDGYNVGQVAYDDAGRLVPGHYEFAIGSDGSISNGVMSTPPGGEPGLPGTFEGQIR